MKKAIIIGTTAVVAFLLLRRVSEGAAGERDELWAVTPEGGATPGQTYTVLPGQAGGILPVIQRGVGIAGTVARIGGAVGDLIRHFLPGAAPAVGTAAELAAGGAAQAATHAPYVAAKVQAALAAPIAGAAAAPLGTAGAMLPVGAAELWAPPITGTLVAPGAVAEAAPTAVGGMGAGGFLGGVVAPVAAAFAAFNLILGRLPDPFETEAEWRRIAAERGWVIDPRDVESKAQMAALSGADLRAQGFH